MSEQQNNSHLSGTAGPKPNQCHKVRHRRKISLSHDACCHHYVMERFKKLICDVQNDEKLGDDHIDAANKQLRSQFEQLRGLSSPVIGQNLSFKRFDWVL